MKRLNSVDIAKGIGILLVVLGHSTFINDTVLRWIFSFHMPLFFIISGILISFKNESLHNYKAIIKKRAKSILIPYAWFSLFYTIIDFISYNCGLLELTSVKINLICTFSFAGSGPLWFLPTLFLTDILFIILLNKFGSIKGIIFSVFLSVTGFIIAMFIGTPADYESSLITYYFMGFLFVFTRALCCQILLSLAYALHKLYAKINPGNVVCIITGTVLLIISIPLALLNNTTIDMHNMNFGNLFLFVPCSFIGSIGLILLSRIFTKIKLLSFWGKNSLTIMATHLNFYLLYLGGVWAMFLNPYITRAKDYIFLFNVVFVAMLFSSVIALLINRFAPFILGRSKKEAGHD